jgi:Meiotically up-regulated gene 113
VIYFIQADQVGHVKIGFTEEADAQVRLRVLQVGSPVKLTLLGTMPGDMTVELELHRRSAAYRVHGEWFKPAMELMELISKGAAVLEGDVIDTKTLFVEVKGLSCRKHWLELDQLFIAV